MIEFILGSTAYGTLPAIVDPADGITPITPDSIACLVIKNGTNTAETVATDAVGGGRTGVYKWSFAADAPVAGDRYSLVYTVTIAAAPYYYTLDLICVAVMRGTDNSLQPTVSGRTLNVNTDGEGDAVLDTATRVKLAADQPDYAPATATSLTAALTKIRKFFQLSLRKDAAISTDNATELTEINADGGSGIGGYLSTTDSQEAIRDNSGGGGGGSATAENQTTIIGHLTDIKGTGWSSATDTLKKIRDAVSNLISTSVVVPGPVLTAVGMPATLEIGDSYEEESCLTIYIRDENDDPVSAAVGHDFTDGDFAPTFVIAPTPGSSRGRVKGIVTYVDPGGSDEPYLKVEIPSSQSKLAVAGEASVQLVLKWTGAEKTLLNTTVIWLPRI